MNIFVDESGSFANAPHRGAWNCVAAYVSPEVDRRYLRDALRQLKRGSGVLPTKAEVKLRDLDELQYFEFLRSLGPLTGTLFAVAIDAGVQNPEEVRAHQLVQADKIEEHKDKMKHEAARRGLEDLAEQIKRIAPQLFVQLVCHIYLIFAVVNRGVLYFVQRVPRSLGVFRWRIDQKNSSKNVFQESFLSLVLPILQTMSLRDPMPMLEGADYRRFERFDYPPGTAPTYLSDDYGIEISPEPKLDLGRLVRDNLQFQDSLTSEGIQAADLLASGLRRCLRGEFSDNQTAANLLGSLMVQDERRHPPLRLIAFGDGEDPAVDTEADRAIRLMERSNRPMLARTPTNRT